MHVAVGVDAEHSVDDFGQHRHVLLLGGRNEHVGTGAEQVGGKSPSGTSVTGHAAAFQAVADRLLIRPTKWALNGRAGAGDHSDESVHGMPKRPDLP